MAVLHYMIIFSIIFPVLNFFYSFNNRAVCKSVLNFENGMKSSPQQLYKKSFKKNIFNTCQERGNNYILILL